MKRLLPLATAASLFLLIVGMKWNFIERSGTDMPDWDQWDAEGLHLYVPWFTKDHFVQELFTPHNEHRIVLSKLQNLAVTLAGGHWDARLETVCNAVLHALLALGLFVLGRRWLAEAPGMGTRPNLLLRGLWFIAVVACIGLPIAWQNILGGFHSQQYWLLGLSFLTLVLLPCTHPRQGMWWLGVLAGTGTLFSMGSGFLAAAAVLVVVIFRLIRRGTTLREAWPTILVCLALCAVGWTTRHEVDYHASLRAKDANEFFLYTVKSLQWPVIVTHFAALLVWLPWLGIVVRAWRNPTDRQPAILAGIGGWVIVQILATAYARGSGADWPSSRYMDTLLFGLAINALTLLWLFSRIGPGTRWRWVAGLAIMALWMGAVGSGLKRETIRSDEDIPNIAGRYRKAEENVRGYLATNDMMFLGRPDIPYPGPDSLRERLDRPSLRPLMPVSLRPALPLQAAKSTGFVAVDSRKPPYEVKAPHAGTSPGTPPLVVYQSFGSFTETGSAATGTWQSAPLAATPGSWLKFEIAGALGEGGDPKLSLTLNDANTGKPLAEVHPKRAPGEAWHAAYVKAPAGPFTVTAVDASPDQWLAFSAPTEMAGLSHLAWRLTKAGAPLMIAAGVAGLLLGAYAFAGAKPRTP